jgi:hypothetical protein
MKWLMPPLTLVGATQMNQKNHSLLIIRNPRSQSQPDAVHHDEKLQKKPQPCLNVALVGRISRWMQRNAARAVQSSSEHRE